MKTPGAVDSGWARQRARGVDTWEYGRTAGGNTTNGIGGTLVESGANPRDVQTWASEPLKLAHYAAYPTALVRFCLRAGTSLRGYCPTCGAPWARIVEPQTPPLEVRTKRNLPTDGAKHSGFRIDGVFYGSGQKMQNWLNEHPPQTLGWRPTCRCPEQEPRPGLVLDPFAGSGRTLLTAQRMGLDSVGCELNPEYIAMARKILRDDAPLFAGGVE